MIASIELTICCLSLAAWGPGGDSLPLESVSAAEADSSISRSLFEAESNLITSDSFISIGPSGGPPAASAFQEWFPGETYGWQLSWNPTLQELSYEIRESASDIELVSWSMTLMNIDSLLFSAQVDGASVLVDNWVLNGVPLDTEILADATADRIDMMLTGPEFETVWRLKGDIAFDWDASQPLTGMSSFGIYGIPVPSPAAGLLLLMPCLINSRRRSPA
ncbi:MAG: hypothetical protein CMJ29_01245 [Phycisphaerae bacterium]|nr:hypothetical protein [Phycisphaerae bacterium]|tara:strand:- start:464 stop:1123 length:660 start_codon:yes stop_codon:yes gene_type:complete